MNIKVYGWEESSVEIIRNALLNWYDDNKRDLPWRVNGDETNKGQRAYEIWTSEIMLQQTQVATVIPYYEKWMHRFPTVLDVAKAELDEINTIWAGLGYYSRAMRLWEGAKKVVEKFESVLPEDAVVLEREIPGIGRYTAGAISSIAYGKRAELVDGNVIRVLARMRAVKEDVGCKATVDLFWSLAKELVDLDRPGDFNQALMELGAMVCTPEKPNCKECPVKLTCRAYAQVEAKVKAKKRSFFKTCKGKVRITRK